MVHGSIFDSDELSLSPIDHVPRRVISLTTWSRSPIRPLAVTSINYWYNVLTHQMVMVDRLVVVTGSTTVKRLRFHNSAHWGFAEIQS